MYNFVSTPNIHFKLDRIDNDTISIQYMLKQTIVDTVCGLKKWRLLIYLVVADNSSNFKFTVPLEAKYAISKTDAFSNVLITSKKPKLLETDDHKEFATKLF